MKRMKLLSKLYIKDSGISINENLNMEYSDEVETASSASLGCTGASGAHDQFILFETSGTGT